MHSALVFVVLSLGIVPLFESVHCISNSPAGRRGIFATSESYPTPPPPPIPKIHYGPKPPQIFVSKLTSDEHLGLPPPPHHYHHPPPHYHHHRGPPTHIHTHVHNSLIPSHAILPPSPPQHSFQLKAPPLRGGHGPPIPTFHIQGLPQIRLQSSISHGPTINHGPFGPPPLSAAPVSPLHHFNQHHGPPRDLFMHNRPMYHSPPSPPPAPTPPTPPPPPPAPPQPPKPFATWKPPPPPPTFRAPAVKESFHASPSAIYQSTNHFLREDEDKGPIHTIPAPNLSLSDKTTSSSSYRKQASQHSQLPHITKPVHSDHTPIDVYSIKGYQVIEDSTAHKPGQPSYFAPDPDPSIQSPRVRPTHDPFSMPSNGQQPLDLIIQQHNEKQSQQFQQLQQLSSSLENAGHTNGNTLTAQDLFNIFSTINQQQLHVIPPAADTDTDTIHSHQNQDDIYNSIQQHLSQPQDFQPQFQTFNYEEQTQKGPKGSDNFPLGASNIEYKRAVGMQQAAQNQFNMQKTAMQGLYRNSMTQQQRQQYENALTKLNNNFTSQKINPATKNRVPSFEKGIINNHVDNADDDQSGEDDEEEEGEEEQTSPDTLSTEDVTLKSLKPLMYTTLPNKKAADTLANLAAAGYSKSASTTVSVSTSLQASDNQDSSNGGQNTEEGGEEEDSGEEEDYSDKQQNSRGMQGQNDNITGKNINYNNNNNNVQLQKAIQIYETSYFDQDIRNRGSSSSNSNTNSRETTKHNDNDDDYSNQDTSDMEESESQSRYGNGNQSNQNSGLSYGTRIRPKRN